MIITVDFLDIITIIVCSVCVSVWFIAFIYNKWGKK